MSCHNQACRPQLKPTLTSVFETFLLTPVQVGPASFHSPLIQTTRRKPRGAAGNEIQLEQRLTDLQEMAGVLSDPVPVRTKSVCTVRP